jgi:hypothetical protein
VNARSRFHFPDSDRGYGVREDDPRVRMAIEGVAGVGDIEMFGILLHVYQDSFAHANHGDVWGHGKAGHDPDEPFRHTIREWRMAKRSYEKMEMLVKARQAMGGAPRNLQGKSFDDFWKRVRPTLLLRLTSKQSATTAEQARIFVWKELISKDFRGANPTFNDRQKKTTNPLTKRVRVVAKKVPIWYPAGVGNRVRDYHQESYWKNWSPVERESSGPRITNPQR